MLRTAPGKGFFTRGRTTWPKRTPAPFRRVHWGWELLYRDSVAPGVGSFAGQEGGGSIDLVGETRSSYVTEARSGRELELLRKPPPLGGEGEFEGVGAMCPVFADVHFTRLSLPVCLILPSCSAWSFSGSGAGLPGMVSGISPGSLGGGRKCITSSNIYHGR